MDFLSGGAAAPKKDDNQKPQADDLSFHVPEPPKATPPKASAPGSDILGGLKNLLAKVDDGKKPEPTLAPKLPIVKLSEPVLPKATMTAPVTPVVPKPPVAPPPPPKAAPIPSPKPMPRDTLRVSLISSGGGAGLTELSVRDRLRKLLFVAVIALVVDGAIFGGILYYTSLVQKQVAGAQEGIKTLDAEIAQAEKDTQPARDLQTLLQGANDALKQHKHWTKVLAMLGQLAKPQVVFSGVTLGEAGTIATTITAPDYLTIAQQILVLRADSRIKSVPFTGAAKNAALVSVPLSINFDPSVLLDGPEPQTK